MIIYRCEMALLPVLRSLVSTVESTTHKNWPQPVPTCISDFIATKVKTRLDLTSHTQFMILYVSGFILFVCAETIMVIVLTISLEDFMVVLFLNATKITYNVFDWQDVKHELTSVSWIFQATCSPNDFTCNDGTCIDRSSVCDGINNCPSGNDEVLCSKMFH